MRVCRQILAAAALLLLCLALAGAKTPSKQTPGDALSAPARLTAKLDHASAKVGETVLLTLEYALPPGASLPDPPKIGGLDKLTIFSQSREAAKIKVKLLVDSLDSWSTGPLTLGYQDDKGKSQTLKAPAQSLQVLSNLGPKPEDARPKPLEDIIPTQSSWLNWFLWIGLASAVALAAAALFWWLRKRRKKVLGQEPGEPPHQRARRELLELEKQGWFEQGRVKPYYYGISEILRRYLGALRGFPAAEYTTEEIARRLDSNSRDRELLPILRRADLVKFADLAPSQASKEEDFNSVIGYLDDTAPSPEPAGQKEAGS